MNKFFKFAPVAVAAIALASCSNDDLFGNANGVAGENGPSIAVSVESQGETRAFATGTGMIDWTDGDVLRVYDAAVQKYDNFAWSGSKFVLANPSSTQYVDPYVGATEEESAFALYAGGNSYDGDDQAVSYSGWKQTAEGGVPVALVYVPKDLNYNESLQSTDASVVVYKSNMPMWGRLSAAATSDAQFKASLSWLTSYVRPRFENANKLQDPIVKVRVQALKFKTTLAAADVTAAKAATVADMKDKDVTTYTFGTSGKKFSELFDADATKYLNGWFDAELKTGGELVYTDDPAIKQPTTNRNVLEVNVEGELVANENYIWIPVISGVTYDVLAITFVTEGTKEYIAAVYFDYEAQRAKGKAVGIEYPNTGYILDGTTTAKVTKGIKESYDGSANAVVYFNKADETSAASQHMTVSTGAASKNTIYLPQITSKNLEIHITNDATTKTTLDENLTIADAAGITSQGTGVVTLYIDEFEDATKNVIVNSKANIVLAGDYSNAGITLVQGDNCENLTLGTSATEFDYGAKEIDATKGNLTVANMDAAGKVKFNNASGTLNVNCALAKATVTKASSATIAGAVTTVEALNNLTINAYDATTHTANSVGTLNIHTGVTAITLTGGIIGEITAEATDATTKVVAADNVTVTSSGLSAIRKNSYATGTIAFTSSFAVPTDASGDLKFVDAFDAAATTGFIYTGAQLAAVAQGGTIAGTAGKQTAFALKTNITGLTNWESPNLTKAFVGGKAAENGLTIAGVDGPLFGTVSANISDVDLTVAISKNANGIGGLAKINGGDVNIENVKVAGTIAGTYNVGGIFGTTKATAANTIKIGDEGTAAKKVEVTATFTNNTSYASPYNGRTPYAGTFGKFIGQAAANTTVVIATECVATAAFDKKALHFDYNRIANEETGMNEWQFKGNTDYIGYSPAATTSLTYGGQAYETGWATDATGVSYNATTKKVTGTVYTLDIYKGTYANLDATTKAAIKTAVGGAWDASYTTAEAAGEVDWSGLVIKSHNSYEAFGAE